LTSVSQLSTKRSDGLVASSVIDLTVTECAAVAAKAGHYKRERVDALAQMLVAASLLQRFRRAKDRREITVEEAQTASEARGWSTLEDAIKTLKEVEQDLVLKGSAALIDQPDDQEEFLEDTDDGSFSDAFGDVERRMDLAGKHPTLFAAVGVDEAYVEKLRQLLQDAQGFHRGREGVGKGAKQMTYQRDLAFSLSLIELKKLQIVLACTLSDRPEHADRIAGKYWRRVDSFARKRRRRKQPVAATEAAQPAEPAGGTPLARMLLGAWGASPLPPAAVLERWGYARTGPGWLARCCHGVLLGVNLS